MKIKASDEALVAHLDGEAVLLHTGSRDYFRLNDSGQTIWRLIEAGSDLDAIVAALVAEFEVDADTAREETRRLVDELEAAGLVAVTHP
jgi:hypothetical protein